MKRKVLFRCLLGAPIGLALSYLITVLISAAVGDGNYYPVVPQLAEAWGGELSAVLVQTGCSLLYGAAWGGASVVWEMERWSLLRMTLTHLAVCSAATFPIAYFMWWMPHSAAGVLRYFGIFFAIYLLIWVSQYWAIKRRIEQMNRKVRQQNEAK